MGITKKLILNILVIIWAIFSLGYILYDVWSDFKITQLNQAYQLGRTDIINQLIQQSQKCEPFPIFSGEKQVNLINADCLKTPETK